MATRPKTSSAFCRKVLLLIAVAFGLFMLVACSAEESSDVCFVGDSITDLWDVEYHFAGENIHKYGIGGSKIEDVLEWNLEKCRGTETVLLIGTNNIPYLENPADTMQTQFYQDFTKLYKQLILKIDASKLYAISVLPRRIKFTEDKAILKTIEQTNDHIISLLKSMNISYKFIDAEPYFLDDGDIIEDYFADGQHLSAEGYERLSALVREAR